MSTIQSKPNRFVKKEILLKVNYSDTSEFLELMLWNDTKDDAPTQIYFILLLLQHQ